MITNGHAKIGYKNSKTDLPELPLKQGCCCGTGTSLINGYEVVDSNGMVMAYFRNEEDMDKFISRFNNGNR